ncbi:hypothetical protein N9M31_07665 [Alphaproteobacteria bacterium]|nr:hypothetical protein [Alphaproteobacteria bacterium]
MLELIFILSFALFVRLLPVRYSVIDFDTWGHVYFASEVKKQNATPWGSIKLQCWQSDNFRHPYLWHYLVGRVPLGLLLPNLKWFNGILDALFATFIYVIVNKVFGDAGMAVTGFMLYLFSPMWFSSIAMGTRVSSFTPRLSSEILVNLVLILILFDLGLPDWLRFGLAILASTSVLLLSKFGNQALLFILPLTYLFSGSLQSWDLLMVLIVSMVLLFLVSGGEALDTLKRQFSHLIEYYRMNLREKSKPNTLANRNQISNLIAISNESGFDFYKSVWNILANNSYTSVIFKLPLYIAVIGMAIMSLYSVNTQLTPQIFAPLMAATLLFFLINRPNFLFLGEAERYLSHVAFFIIIAGVHLAQNLDLVWPLWVLIFYGASYWLCECFLINRLTAKKGRQDADMVVEKFLSEQGRKRLVNSFPYHNFSLYRIMLLTKHEVLIPDHMKGNLREKFKSTYESRYGYLDLNKLDEIHQITSLNTIIIDKMALISEGFSDWTPSKDWEKVELHQSVYDIYQR